MHLKRWLSGLVLAPCLILFILYAPLWGFFLFIAAAAAIGLREYYGLALPGASAAQKAVGLALGLLLLLAVYKGGDRLLATALVLILFSLFIPELFRPEDFSIRVDRLARGLLGIFYVPFFLAHFILLRQIQWGQMWVLFVLVAVYFGDTAAFYVGRTWGRRKLAPRISPGKTVEGFLGAVGGSMVGALLFKFLFFPQLPPASAAVLGCGAGILGQLGDLCESLLKRGAGMKDSGALIPGHGGLLDRIDSVLFAGAFVYAFAWMTGLG